MQCNVMDGCVHALRDDTTSRSFPFWAWQDLCPGRYNGPQIAANAMSLYYTSESDRATIRVLDVAAGTGRVGYELDKLGFK